MRVKRAGRRFTFALGLIAAAVLAALTGPPARADGRTDPATSGDGDSDSDSAGDTVALDRELASAARLPIILRAIARRSPDLREAVQRASAAEARAGAAGRLPDPELKGELWGVPVTRPLSFDQANTIMLGLRQAFPAWGSLDARERAAREEAALAGATTEGRRHEITAQARRAFAAYARADREYRIHLEHVGLTSRLVEIARSLYQVGHGSQPDFLRAQAELSRLHVDVAAIEQQRRSAQAMLNALMDRAPDATLGPVPELSPVDALATPPTEATADADRLLPQRRPELKAAAHAVKRSEAALQMARREADFPSLTVGADYWYMPTQSTHHGYGAMVSMSLPWLNPRHRDEVKAAERAQAAERSALRAQQAAARFALRDADAKVQAARETLTLLHDRVLTDARRSFESAQAQFQSGQGNITPVLDAARSYLMARIDEVRALADLESSRADFARAAGLPVGGLTDGADAADTAGRP